MSHRIRLVTNLPEGSRVSPRLRAIAAVHGIALSLSPEDEYDETLYVGDVPRLGSPGESWAWAGDGRQKASGELRALADIASGLVALENATKDGKHE